MCTSHRERLGGCGHSAEGKCAQEGIRKCPWLCKEVLSSLCITVKDRNSPGRGAGTSRVLCARDAASLWSHRGDRSTARWAWKLLVSQRPHQGRDPFLEQVLVCEQGITEERTRMLEGRAGCAALSPVSGVGGGRGAVKARPGGRRGHGDSSLDTGFLPQCPESHSGESWPPGSHDRLMRERRSQSGAACPRKGQECPGRGLWPV